MTTTFVANSFDQWQKDPFFDAAEQVQHSADIMESMYRLWEREGNEALELDHSLYELRRDLQIALGTAKWQLDEFERAVRLSHGDNTTTRHRQFIDVTEDLISRVEGALRESLAEENQPLQWVNLDSDDLEAFLSGKGSSLSTADNISLDGDDRISDHMRRSYKEVENIINEDFKYGPEQKEFPQTCNNEMDSIGLKSSPNIGSWKIVIADEDDQRNTVMELCDVESTTKKKGLSRTFWGQNIQDHRQANKAAISNFLDIRGITKVFKRWSIIQRKLQGSLYFPSPRILQVMLLMLLLFLLIGEMYVTAP